MERKRSVIGSPTTKSGKFISTRFPLVLSSKLARTDLELNPAMTISCISNITFCLSMFYKSLDGN